LFVFQKGEHIIKEASRVHEFLAQKRG